MTAHRYKICRQAGTVGYRQGLHPNFISISGCEGSFERRHVFSSSICDTGIKLQFRVSFRVELGPAKTYLYTKGFWSNRELDWVYGNCDKSRIRWEVVIGGMNAQMGLGKVALLRKPRLI